jgi:hypothetical protein
MKTSAVTMLSVFLIASAFLGTAVADEAKIKPVRALLVLGGCCHDYNAQKDLLAKGISERAHVDVVIALDTDTTTGHKNRTLQAGT